VSAQTTTNLSPG